MEQVINLGKKEKGSSGAITGATSKCLRSSCVIVCWSGIGFNDDAGLFHKTAITVNCDFNNH